MTVTPPCCDAPSDAEVLVCNPAPSASVPPMVIPGPVTVTVRVPVVVIVTTPGGPVTVTCVVPTPVGSKASPYGEMPPVTDCG